MQGLTPRRKKGAIVAGVLIFLYAITGFFVLPPILRPKIVEAIREQTNCEASIGELRMNPFALSVTLENFALLDRDHRPIVSFKELYINFETSSLFRRAYTFSAIRLSSPRIFVGIRADGSTNLSDIRQPADEHPDTAEAVPTRVLVQDLAIDSGKIAFEDLARPVPYSATFDSLGLSLKDFTTIPDETGEYQFEASTGRNELIRWKGKFSVVPLRSSGSFSLSNLHGIRLWEYVQHLVNFKLPSSVADFRADYNFDLSHHTNIFELHNGSLNARDILMWSTIDNVEGVNLPKLSVTGIEVSYLKKEVTVGAINVSDLALANVLSADGKQITLRDMFIPKLQPGEVPTKMKHLAWKILLKEITCSSGRFHNEDRSTNPVAVLDVDSIRMTMRNYRVDEPLPAELTASAVINGSGSVSSKGTMTVNIDSLSVDILQEAELAGLTLAPFQPYVSAYAKVELKSGTLSGKGKGRFFQQGAIRKMEFAGDVQSAGFRMTDTVLHEDFLRFSRLEMKKMAFSQFTNSVSIGEIVMHQPYLRAIIGPDRVTNLQNMMVKDSTISDSAAGPHAGAPAHVDRAPGAEAKKMMRTRIGVIRVLDGSLKFSDLSLTPNFAVGVEEMSGTISKLSSDELSRAEVDLKGKVDKYAPAIIKGQVNPLSEDAFTDITMSFHGIELTTFTPYSGRFAGYKIDKGKLSVDLHYKLNKSQLDAENKIVIDQLTLGEKVESPDATSLPVKLAIALLKDSHGVIDLDIPVSGNINDPEFSVMPIVLKAVVNVFVKAVSAPFKLLGSLFGGGDEELNLVEFGAGSDSLSMRERGKLTTLAKGLTEKVELSLEIRGIVVDSLDRTAIAIAGVLAQVKPPIPPGKIIEAWTPQEKRGVIRLYGEKFKEDSDKLVVQPDGGAKEMTPEEIELASARVAFNKLVASYNVDDESLRTLANRRADAVKSFLVIDNHIGEERIFLIDVNLRAPAKDGLVQMELALQVK